eukprot:227332_1
MSDPGDTALAPRWDTMSDLTVIEQIRDLCLDSNIDDTARQYLFRLMHAVSSSDKERINSMISDICHDHKRDVAWNHCVPYDYTKCIAMNRLLTAFKHYSMLKAKGNDDILTRFMNDLYTQLVLIDDCIHFTETHEHQLQQIYEELIKSKQFSGCDITKCKFTARHQRQRTLKPIAVDHKLNFYMETFDGLHFHLLHLFDVGLRTKQSHDGKTSKVNDRYHDAEFARTNQMILERRHLTTSFPRFSPKHNKFSIPIDHPKKTNSNRTYTYLDQLIMSLFKSNIGRVDIETLAQFVNEEQYDSEAIDFDYEFKPNNNFSTKYVANRTIVTQWHSFIKGVKGVKSECSSFNIGYRFYYWPMYKHLKEIRLDSYNTCYNTWNHSGYYCFELFIEFKYDSFKEEIAHYKYLSLAQYEKVVVKVKAHLQLRVFKKTSGTVSQYAIKENDPIQSSHLLALTLYTDYEDLCTDFSSTFRKCDSLETMEAVKKRNAAYYWMSRRLRECVEVFGQFNGYDARYHDCHVNPLTGPFYCGIKCVLTLSHFNLRLCAPTSTSKQIQVAMKFSKRNGIIIQMDNPDRVQYKHLRGFNASWISRYPEEDERIFFGGWWYMQVQSIQKRSTNQSFEQSIYSFYYLDVLLTGGEIEKLAKLKKSGVLMLKCLVNDVLTANEHGHSSDIDPYIRSTFDAFIQARK